MKFKNITKYIFFLIICSCLSACTGIYFSGYDFPSQFREAKIYDILFDESGHIINWDDDGHLFSSHIENRNLVLSRLKDLYPLDSDVSTAEEDLQESGFSCEEISSSQITECHIQAGSSVYTKIPFIPFSKSCMGSQRLIFTISLIGDSQIEDITIYKSSTQTPCEE